MNPQNRIAQMRERIEQALHPTLLEIIDESHLHAGHAGAKTGLGHFAMKIASPAFQNKNLLECHRMVYDAVGDMMQTDIHALKIIIINL